MKTFNIIIVVAVAILMDCQVVWSDATLNSDPDFAWQQVQQAAQKADQGPPVPDAWKTQPPTRDQRKQWYMQQASMCATAATAAKSFYAKFPDSPNALAAKKLECELLTGAFHGDEKSKSAYTALANAQDTLLSDTNLTDDDHFELRLEVAERLDDDPNLDETARNAACQKALHQLIKDYPNRPEVYEQLANLAMESPDDQARVIAGEIIASSAPSNIKAMAQGILSRLDAIGKPLDIRFTALDGGAVDLSQMKGKVVLVDFWATWCGPCVGEVPNVEAAYDKYHSQGFEVVGISFDKDKQALKNFTESHRMPWPQYFDGMVWKNKFGVQFGIDGIPTMWLVDKKGILRDTNARGRLDEVIPKLLAEK